MTANLAMNSSRDSAANSESEPEMPHHKLQPLIEHAPVVLPSMLLCDFGNLQREVERLQAGGARGFHLDVMDGQFVPNMTYGLPIVRAFRQLTQLPIDVHLMIDNPQNYVEQFVEAGADSLTFHVEAAGVTAESAAAMLNTIRSAGAAAGIAVNPATRLDAWTELLELSDLVCVMSVEAGFGGQSFQSQVLEKLDQIRKLAGDRVVLEIDGGVNSETIGSCVAAGAQLLVAGSAILNHENYGAAFEQLQLKIDNELKNLG